MFFDGADQQNTCGCGVHIIMDEKLQYFISWNGGKGTNSMAEARALAGLLALCIFFIYMLFQFLVTPKQ